jgi:hypothetical protein
MKTPKDLVGHLETRGDFRHLSESGLGERRTVPIDHPIHELWLTLSEIYGSQFVSSYGEEPSMGWFGVLADMSLDQLATGLRAAAKSGKSFAPNGVEFRALCGGDDWESKRLHKPHLNPIQIEDKGKKERNDTAHQQWRKEMGLT